MRIAEFSEGRKELFHSDTAAPSVPKQCRIPHQRLLHDVEGLGAVQNEKTPQRRLRDDVSQQWKVFGCLSIA